LLTFILIYFLQKSLEEGYAAIYHKLKTKDPSDHPWYKIYNMRDYKKMQQEVRLNRGTLGPDLDTESYKDKVCSQLLCLLSKGLVQNYCNILILQVTIVLHQAIGFLIHAILLKRS